MGKRIVTIILVTILFTAGCGMNSQEPKGFVASAQVKMPAIDKVSQLVEKAQAAAQAAQQPVVNPNPVTVSAPVAKKLTQPATQVDSVSRGVIKGPVVNNTPSGQAMANRKIVINKSAFTLTLYDNNTPIKTYSVTVGRPGHETPEGHFAIGNMLVNPEYFGNSGGTVGYIPGGDYNNPLGSRWMGITYGPNAPDTYGIHEEFWQTGRAASSGCVRMMRADLEDLFSRVAVGTPVWINP